MARELDRSDGTLILEIISKPSINPALKVHEADGSRHAQELHDIYYYSKNRGYRLGYWGVEEECHECP